MTNDIESEELISPEGVSIDLNLSWVCQLIGKEELTLYHFTMSTYCCPDSPER